MDPRPDYWTRANMRAPFGEPLTSDEIATRCETGLAQWEGYRHEASSRGCYVCRVELAPAARGRGWPTYSVQMRVWRPRLWSGEFGERVEFVFISTCGACGRDIYLRRRRSQLQQQIRGIDEQVASHQAGRGAASAGPPPTADWSEGAQGGADVPRSGLEPHWRRASTAVTVFLVFLSLMAVVAGATLAGSPGIVAAVAADILLWQVHARNERRRRVERGHDGDR